jgi:transposase InsO family protein
MDLKLVFNTIKKLKKYFKINNLKLDNVLIHSDQGFQYTHSNYKNILNNLKIIQSMSRKGNSIDNAIIETFFGHLKDEIDFKDINSFFELNREIKKYMVYFNNQRPQ